MDPKKAKRNCSLCHSELEDGTLIQQDFNLWTSDPGYTQKNRDFIMKNSGKHLLFPVITEPVFVYKCKNCGHLEFFAEKKIT
jgi:hypothetical protein